MGALMDLVAGDAREILLGVALDDWEGFADTGRFDAHLSLGGGLDPSWLDLYAEAARGVTGGREPLPFSDACSPLDGPADVGERRVERVEPAWIVAVARLPDGRTDAIAARWIELVEAEFGEPLEGDEKTWIRGLAGGLAAFARAAAGARDVLFAWTL